MIIVMIIVMTIMTVSFLAAGQPADFHNAWDALVKKHVLSGKVNYKGFIADKAGLEAYLQKLAAADISAYSGNQKLAYWINAYNAYTVKLIVDNYPLKSIRDLSRPWKKKFCRVAGYSKAVSLDFIEHKILRKEFAEPRIHFAIVCASIGCPDLQPFAFRGDQIEAQLGTVARTFFTSPKHFKIIPDEEDGRYIYIHISKIFQWFGDDFGPNKKAWAAYFRQYAQGENLGLLEHAETIRIKYLKYDWNLNDNTAR